MACEEFPNNFDVVVLGTGLTETIAAAAFSRIGLKVLHLDRNDYYGGAYSNFNLDGIEDWRKANETRNRDCNEDEEIPDKVKDLLQNGETVISLNRDNKTAFNIQARFHVRERTTEEQAKADLKFNTFKFPSLNEPNPTSDISQEEEEKKEDAEQSESPSTDSGVSSCTEKLNERLSLTTTSDNTAEVCEIKDFSQPEPPKSYCEDSHAAQVENPPKRSEWTVGDIKDDWRRYCLDISPKILYCCGDLVDLLIQSDVARYCEFRSVSRVLTVLNNLLLQVPCSRADVFSSKAVSLIEKRLMMKFLQFAIDYESSPQEYQNYLDKPFIEFLKSKKLTPNIQHYIQHAIAMVTDSELTQVGLTKTKKFIQSLGRYGNTAFLFPLYGTGELPQAFSRLSAVFGGIYCLATTATHLIADSDRKCCGIITSKGQRISCRYVIAECSYLPPSLVLKLNKRMLSRAVYITDNSLLPTGDSELSLLHYVSPKDSEKPVTVLELPSSACVCPKNTFIIHLTTISNHNDPSEDFNDVRETLFANEVSVQNEATVKPKILWSIYFNQEDNSKVKLTEDAVTNVLVASGGGDPGVDLDWCVAEAKVIFHTVCPTEEFLPKPPNPEDIILVDDAEASTSQGTSEYQVKNEEEISEIQETVSTDSVQEAV
ncbi:rab proteins geranylgeranyltransferase component A 2-like [Biomphalaria glabrata]|uniref:Rab proteins geranylgeranyltransferase component A n=1 Tax=Biomphalaria glabrata TaxID=6526 RepID=A0A9W3B5X6_BIOGL|nr:rab proteins geranylgeranyltransferase component A 2-like [Biomphalaria glabrata]XP_055894909.1 rab proteins geranylgeranyltransferase component A 2-like [Biomphalaria glabrata]XP_055894910.1 rab proteins geranylgeranyltransferase component A 2-like [Biomphalaria glabrata]XP_055894911.1 rab proteins geranylgeranyltransferase component A 2-like [Biomphalaria glabrata]